VELMGYRLNFTRCDKCGILISGKTEKYKGKKYCSNCINKILNKNLK
jgi:formylmethanofuran dehydrogenase subunit E